MNSGELSHPKILDLPQLLPIVERLKEGKQRIVFTNGCFDLLHPGHADLLERAKAMGDLLIVGLNSDESVSRMEKGSGRPVNPFQSRAFLLAHFTSVDFIVGFSGDTPIELIKALRPHVLVKGGDWSVNKIVGNEIVKADDGVVASLPLLIGYSTTGIIKKILEKCR